MVRWLLQQAPAVVNRQDHQGETPLVRLLICSAARGADGDPSVHVSECVRVLVGAGADVNAQVGEHRGVGRTTLLNWAVQKERCCDVRVLLAAGASVEGVCPVKLSAAAAGIGSEVRAAEARVRELSASMAAPTVLVAAGMAARSEWLAALEARLAAWEAGLAARAGQDTCA